MPTNANILLQQTNSVDPAGAIFSGRQMKQQINQMPARNKLLDLTNTGKDLSNQSAEMGIEEQGHINNLRSVAEGVMGLDPYLQSNDVQGGLNYLGGRIKEIQAREGDATNTINAYKALQSGDVEGLKTKGASFIQDMERMGVLKGINGSAGSKAFAPVPMADEEGNFTGYGMPTFNPDTGASGLNPISAPGGSGFANPSTLAGDKAAATERAKLGAQLDIKPEIEGAVTKAKGAAETTAASEKRFAEKIGEEGASIYSNLQQAAQSASEFIPRLQSLRDLAYQVETGTGAEIKLAAKKALGIDSADMEELNAKLGELAQDILNQQTGTKTDFDFENAVRQSAALGKTPEANARLINAMIDRQQQAIYFADQAKKAYDKGGVKAILDMRYDSAPADKNQQALDWARSHPEDPRAQQIMKKIGG